MSNCSTAQGCANQFKLVTRIINTQTGAGTQDDWLIKHGASVCRLPRGLVGLEHIHQILACDNAPEFVWTTGGATVQKEVRIWAASVPLVESAPEEMRSLTVAKIRTAITQWNLEARAASAACNQRLYDELMLKVLRSEEYLRETTAIGGKSRRFPDQQSRDADAVRKAIARAIAAIRKLAPAIAEHFSATIVGSNGEWFYSEPDIEWDTTEDCSAVIGRDEPGAIEWAITPRAEDPEVVAIRRAWLNRKIGQAEIEAAIRAYRSENTNNTEEVSVRGGGWNPSDKTKLVETDDLEGAIEQWEKAQANEPSQEQKKIEAAIRAIDQMDVCWWDV